MAIKIKPDFALAHYKLGIALFHAKMTEEAMESGVLNNQIEIKFYSKLDDGLSAQLFPAQKPMKKK